jgi:hypothetical protein
VEAPINAQYAVSIAISGPAIPGGASIQEWSMGIAKQIVFQYNGDPATEEIDLDMDGDKSVPEQGSFMDRRGERWKVVQVSAERNAAEPFTVPIYRVFLINEP